VSVNFSWITPKCGLPEIPPARGAISIISQEADVAARTSDSYADRSLLQYAQLSSVILISRHAESLGTQVTPSMSTPENIGNLLPMTIACCWRGGVGRAALVQLLDQVVGLDHQRVTFPAAARRTNLQSLALPRRKTCGALD
jgi:hypothetical protein